MTLAEFIDSVADDEIIHFGSKSAFLFIGTKEDFWKDIPKIEFLAKEKLVARYLSALTNIEEVKRGFKYEGNSSLDSLIDYADELMAAGKKLKTSLNTRDALKPWINNYVVFLDRNVTDTYKRRSDKGLVVLVEGEEIASFWTINEYKKVREKGKFERGCGADD